MSTDMSVGCRPMYRPVHRLTVGRCVDRCVGQGVHKIHMILNTFVLIKFAI